MEKSTVEQLNSSLRNLTQNTNLTQTKTLALSDTEAAKAAKANTLSAHSGQNEEKLGETKYADKLIRCIRRTKAKTLGHKSAPVSRSNSKISHPGKIFDVSILDEALRRVKALSEISRQNTAPELVEKFQYFSVGG